MNFIILKVSAEQLPRQAAPLMNSIKAIPCEKKLLNTLFYTKSSVFTA
jgi:hypothetical protein